MSSSKDAMWIMNALDLAVSACETISEKSRCSECPMFANCLMDTPFEQVQTDVPTTAFRDMLDMADELIDYVSEEDARAVYEDQMRDFYRDMELEFEEI